MTMKRNYDLDFKMTADNEDMSNLSWGIGQIDQFFCNIYVL